MYDACRGCLLAGISQRRVRQRRFRLNSEWLVSVAMLLVFQSVIQLKKKEQMDARAGIAKLQRVCQHYFWLNSEWLLSIAMLVIFQPVIQFRGFSKSIIYLSLINSIQQVNVSIDEQETTVKFIFGPKMCQLYESLMPLFSSVFMGTASLQHVNQVRLLSTNFNFSFGK